MTITLSENLVKTNLRIKPNETVLISTWQHTIELASNIAFECRRIGAVPLILTQTDDLWWKSLTRISEHNLRKPERHGIEMLDETDVYIEVFGPQNPLPLTYSTYRRVTKSKLNAMFEAGQVWYDKLKRNKVRCAALWIGYVTKERAKTLGYDYAHWKRATETASNIDYEKMTRVGNKLASILEAGRQVEVVSEEGTSLQLQCKGRAVSVEDGIVDENDLKKGLFQTYLPTGMVVIAPDEKSAEGTVYFDMPTLPGRIVKGLKWVFRRGTMVKATAEKHPEAFLKLFDASTGDKDRIATLSIGINPAVRPMGYPTDPYGKGIVSIAIGHNLELGGNNKSTLKYSGGMARATIKIDGKVLVARGRIRI